ncbi:uncharacterized protein N7503_006961 [Penicillium pulvis]|uniref:uncharacterized protein n=1 Tax=Penicillium pulvis TaxID=1562058 RepID=UPI002548EE1C|nr:uncharacterized protein N7503_006961 [Penicillium pulvis]KAJ5797665.1 hypothetical protein N7503_006961 [Penicillium pulvis]
MDLKSIHRWLSKVPDAHSAGNATDDPSQLGLAVADTSLISPNIVDSTRKHVQVEDDSLGQGQIQSEKAGHELQPSFDRKPRHKTREDRYEYKGASTIRPQSTSYKDNKKRRLSRKHTMNDVFRAPNVARERLTLRGNLNVGIFNKGKASSPMKLGHGEQNRISKMAEDGSADDINKFPILHSPNEDFLPKSTHSLHQSLQERKRGASRQQKRPVYIFSELVKELETEWNNTEQLSSQAGKFEQPNEEPRIDQGHCVGRTSDLDVQREHSILTHPVKKIASWSQSDTPYTWSETNPGNLQPELALEIELLKLLHVGLLPTQRDDWARTSNQNHTYYSLDELKDILNSRQEYWASESSQTRQIVATSPDAEFHKTCESLRKENSMESVHAQARNSITEKLSHDKIISRGPRQISSRPISQVHNKKKVDSISQPESLEKMRLNINDTQEAQKNQPDDLFFNNLDAAFWAIVDPKTQNKMDSLVMMGVQQSLPTFDFEDIMTTAELVGAGVSKVPSQGLLSHAQVGVETLYPLPPAAHDYFDPNNRVTHPENDQGDAMMLQSPQQGFSSRMKRPRQPRLYPSITHESSDDQVPPGFWRQNRLY